MDVMIFPMWLALVIPDFGPVNFMLPDGRTDLPKTAQVERRLFQDAAEECTSHLLIPEAIVMCMVNRGYEISPRQVKRKGPPPGR